MKCFYEKCSYCIHRKECDYLNEIKKLKDKLNTIGNFIQNFHFEQDLQIVELIKKELAE